MENYIIDILKDLINIDTRKSQNNEIEIARYLKSQFDDMKISYETFEPSLGKGSIIARIPGETEECVVLYSHIDTEDFGDVQKWNHYPGEAIQVANKIFGRGALDCKGLIALWLGIMNHISCSGKKPLKTLVFIAVADEESGGHQGTKWLLENTDYFRNCILVLSEGGGYPLKLGSKVYFTCQVGEKEQISFPNTYSKREFYYFGNPIINLLKSLKVRVVNFNAVIFIIEQLLNRKAKRKISINDLLKNRYQIQKGYVIIDKLPYIEDNKILSYIPYIHNMKYSKIATGYTRINNSVYKIIEKELKKHNKNHYLLPVITPGYSDNRFFRNKGIKVFGFFPLDYSNGISGIHGINEYITTDSISLSYKILLGIVEQLVY